ncbi:MAG: universal stress protein [Deltaproteobacteria bacterium]|nr:universal stress protein [Deltaproteobacteria bacterium]
MKIMLCYGGSNESKQGMIEAEKQARAFHGKVLVVASHVIDDQSYPMRIEPTELGLKGAQAFFDERGIPCQTILAYRDFDDPVGEHLLEIAKEHQVDEIIVGIKNRSRVGKLLLGSVAQFLLLKADCPVLGVKNKL